MWVTIQLSLVSMLIAVVVGLIACMGSLSRIRVLRFPSVLFVEFGRNTPILVQLIWVHFAWPEILGLKFSA
jgi:polar amino acid transport system permease protein